MAQLIIRPTGAGDETNQIPSPEVANYLNVDEATPDEDTTRNRTYNPAIWYRDLYAMGDCGLAVGTIINWIEIYMRLRAQIANGAAYTLIKSGGTVYQGTTIDVYQNGYADFYTPYTTIGGAAITPAMIDAIQGGCGILAGDKAFVYNTQIYILVGFTPLAVGKVQAHVL